VNVYEMSDKWSNDDILAFLDVYKEYEVLWNAESDEYRNRNARNEGIKKLLEEMCVEGLTADCDRKKIKLNKTVYSQELNKIIKSKKSGTGTNDLYKPKLVWFEKADSFLRSVIATRLSKSNLVSTVRFKYFNTDSNQTQSDVE
jgi:hypothetical protein